MKLKIIIKKLLTIYILIILILSCNITLNLSAKLIPDYDDGVIYDEFDDEENVALNNCNLQNSYIELTNESHSIFYNYNDTSSKINAWMLKDTYITPGSGDFVKLISNFVNPDKMPGYEFTTTEYSKLKKEIILLLKQYQNMDLI